MRTLIVSAALVALSVSSALAFGPSTSDANPPGALFQSKPDGWNPDGTPKLHSPAINSAPVGLSHPKADRRHRH